MSGLFSLFAAIATLAGMAAIIGLFNRWPAHETFGSLVVCLAFWCLAFIADRRLP